MSFVVVAALPILRAFTSSFFLASCLRLLASHPMVLNLVNYRRVFTSSLYTASHPMVLYLVDYRRVFTSSLYTASHPMILYLVDYLRVFTSSLYLASYPMVPYAWPPT